MYKNFYKEGITEIDFSNNKIDKILKSILEKNLKEGYKLEEKYQRASDLRPDILSYDKVFTDILAENNIKKVIKDITLRDLVLFHIQVRVVENNVSYMNWHRDTYYNEKNELVGQAPHGVKIIYYPDLDGLKSERLLYLVGSNRIVFPDNRLDQSLAGILKARKVFANSGKAILFDTCGLHAVVPEMPGKKSIRVIYSFLTKEQVIKEQGDKKLQMDTVKLYESL